MQDIREQRVDLAAALRLAVRYDMHEGICNHFSVAVGGDRYLINPWGRHWSELQASDLALVDGEGDAVLTGQLGDVMKESASIARSVVGANAERFGVELPAGKRLHVHFPAGAIPKDGPSAGVTMTTALVSLLSGRNVKPTIGMTGEVTLQGRVLPIGGVKQKVLAAHRAGLSEVIVPIANGDDLEDVPADVLEQLTVHLAADISQVLEWALEPAAA